MAVVVWLAACPAYSQAPKGQLQQAQQQSAQQPPSVGADPQTTAATYGDWIVGCQSAPGATPVRRCEISQSLQVQGAGRIAQIVMGRLDAKSPLLLTVVLPTNVSFSDPVRFLIDEKDNQPVGLTWQRCLPSGCFANVEVKDDVLRRYRAQTERGRLQFKDGAGREIILPFSFRGLAQALDALAKG